MGLVTFGEKVCPNCGMVFPDPPKIITFGITPSPLKNCGYCGTTYCPNCSASIGLRTVCPNCGSWILSNKKGGFR